MKFDYVIRILKGQISDNNSWETGSDYSKENTELNQVIKILESEDK